MVGIKIDQLDDEHGEQPLRRKPEETELPVECLHSEWTLNRFLLTYVLRHCCIRHRHEQVRRQPYKGFIDQAKPIRKNTGIDFGQPAAPMVSKLLHSSLTVARIPETGPSFVGCLMSPLCGVSRDSLGFHKLSSHSGTTPSRAAS